jgi:hypothetical protein
MSRKLNSCGPMIFSAALFLAVSSAAFAQTPSGTTTAADLERAGYSDVTETSTTSETAVSAFEAVAPDGSPVTIEIQRGTGEWLVLRHQPRDVVTIYRPGEAPPHARPIPGSAAPMEGEPMATPQPAPGQQLPDQSLPPSGETGVQSQPMQQAPTQVN